MEKLTSQELKSLITSVFTPGPSDKNLAILVDVPDTPEEDDDKWLERRAIAYSWAEEFQTVAADLNLDSVNLILYPNVHNNNADLPEYAYTFSGDISHLTTGTLRAKGEKIAFAHVLGNNQIFMALTEYSATAPLKLQAAKYGFRAATMPGFSSEMIPALRLDYEEINRRVLAIKKILDEATGVEIEFTTDDDHQYHIHFDLRFRKGHASGGRFPEKGSAGNLPSGESYIVPYEGEKEEISLSEGTLPVQFDDEIVLYRIEKNTAVEILSKGRYSDIEAQKIKNEPAYANISEIGFGVLSDFGISPIGEILLDEKLGLHIAFGRSDHFGGAIGIKDFTSPENVIHIDRIYIPETQSRITARYVKIINQNSGDFQLMENGRYTIF